MATAQEVAAFTAACEKYVGTESGGMDQAISIMGAKDLAKLVHFKPVRPCRLSLSYHRSSLAPACKPAALHEVGCMGYMPRLCDS